MSIIIKGMEMPKNCGDCLTNYMLNVVCDCDLNNIEDGRRMPNCPLIELPPHGRLGDLDELIEKYGEWYTEEGTESGYIGTMKNLLDGASTVIEAEE